MANNVDKRIVEMQFDNAQFENGVRTSTQSLEKLKQGLNFSGVEKSTAGLSKSLQLNGVADNVNHTASLFERFKARVPNVMQTAGKAMLGFGIAATGALTGVSTALTGLTIKGGITRAMNLKQADFMLQGLVKDEKQVAAIMDNVQASVDGTAYSLDQAALVASQFAATGMRGGEKMENALKGVAGAAAVFGADYQRIGQIFTQVSGQGRLMGNDLLQLSTYGMNAAATLADYFSEVKGQAGTTEAEIRDMVSKGQIDFQTFAEAMNWAFGDQAAKANETFTGALANLKSAFSRIGEKVASPTIDALRDIFNAIRPLVNLINEYLTPDLKILGDYIGTVGEKAAKMFTWFGEGSKSWKYANGEAVKPMQNAFQSIHKILYEISRLLSPIKEAFFDVFNPSRTGITDFLKKFHELALGFNISDKTISNLRNTFKGFFAIIDLLGKGFGILLKFMSPLLSVLSSIGSVFLSITGRIGNAIYKINEMTESSEALTSIFEFLASIGSAVAEIFKAIVGSVTDVLSVSTGLKDLTKSSQNAGTIVGNAFSKMSEGIKAFGKGASDTIHSINFDFIKKVIGAGILIRLGQIFSKMVDLIVTGVKQIKSAGLGAILEEVRLSLVSYQAYLKADILIKIATAIAILTGSLVVLSMIDPKKLASGLGAMAIMMGELTGALSILMLVSKDAKGIISISTALLLLSISIGIMANALRKISGLSLKELGKGLLGLTGVSIILVGVAKMLSRSEGRIVRGSGALILFAIAIEELTEAVKTLGDMNIKKLAKGLIGVGVLVGELSLLMSSFGKGGGVFKAVGILILAHALVVLSDAVKSIGGENVSSLVKSIVAIKLILLELSAFSKTTKNAGSLIVSAAGIYILAKAMTEFANVISVLGGMSVKELAKGIFSLGGALLIIGKSMKAMPKNLIVTGAGLIIVANAIEILAGALISMSGMSMTEIGKSLVSLGGGLIIIAGAMKLMQGSIGGAAAMLVMAAAIRIFTPAMVALSSLSIAQIGVGLLALAGSFAVLGLAGALLAPLVPAIIALAGAVALIGLAAALAGAGVSLFATGLATLAAISPASINGIVESIKALATGIPEIFRYVGEGIIEIIAIIGENAAKISEVALQLLISFMTTINNNIYKIVSLGVQIIANFINGIADNIELIIQAGTNLMVNFINGMANSIRENQDVILAAVGNLMAAIITFVLTAMQAIYGEIPIIGDKISDGLEKAKKSVDDKFNPDEAKKTSEKYGDGFTSGFDKAKDKAKESGEKIAKNATDGMGKKDLAKKAASGLGSAYNTTLGKAVKNTRTAGEKYPEMAAKGMSKTKNIKNSGTASGKSYNDSLGKMSGKSSKVGEKLGKKAAEGAKNKKGFNEAGTNAASGFVSGASTKNTEAYNAGWKLASSYYNAIKKRLEEHSPSKATYKLALFAVKGFVKPAYDYSYLARNAGTNLAQAMLTGIKKNSSDIIAAADSIDLIPNQPVIRPVVDMSNVYSAAGEVGSLFNANSSMRAAASISAHDIQQENAMNRLMTSISAQLGKMAESNSSSVPMTNNFNISGAENPEDFANRFLRQLEIEMRTG